MVSLGAVLEGFHDEVIQYVTDPRTGIQRRLKWPPTINELIVACEDHQQHLARLRKPKPVFIQRPADPLERPRGYLAQIFVPENHQRYPKLLEWTERADEKFWKHGTSSDGRSGLWVAYPAWLGETK